MDFVSDPHCVTIKVSGGFMQDIYTTLSFNIAANLPNLGCTGRKPPEAVANMNAYLEKVNQEQQKFIRRTLC